MNKKQLQNHSILKALFYVICKHPLLIRYAYKAFDSFSNYLFKKKKVLKESPTKALKIPLLNQ